MRESQRREEVGLEGRSLAGDPRCDELCCHGSEKNTVAVVPRCHNQSFNVGWPKNREIIGGAGTQTSPHFGDFHRGERWSQLECGVHDLLYPCGRHGLLVSGVLESASCQDAAVWPWNQITICRPQNPPKPYGLSLRACQTRSRAS